jgi:acyl carrier protein
MLLDQKQVDENDNGNRNPDGCLLQFPVPAAAISFPQGGDNVFVGIHGIKCISFSTIALCYKPFQIQDLIRRSILHNMSQEILDAVVAAVARQKNIPPASIQPETSLEEIGISSLDAITIVYEIEDAFDVEVPNEKLESLKTVQDIVDGVAELMEAGG